MTWLQPGAWVGAHLLPCSPPHGRCPGEPRAGPLVQGPGQAWNQAPNKPLPLQASAPLSQVDSPKSLCGGWPGASPAPASAPSPALLHSVGKVLTLPAAPGHPCHLDRPGCPLARAFLLPPSQSGHHLPSDALAASFQILCPQHVVSVKANFSGRVARLSRSTCSLARPHRPESSWRLPIRQRF